MVAQRPKAGIAFAIAVTEGSPDGAFFDEGQRKGISA
jgi:hypothetical protein